MCWLCAVYVVKDGQEILYRGRAYWSAKANLLLTQWNLSLASTCNWWVYPESNAKQNLQTEKEIPRKKENLSLWPQFSHRCTATFCANMLVFVTLFRAMPLIKVTNLLLAMFLGVKNQSMCLDLLYGFVDSALEWDWYQNGAGLYGIIRSQTLLSDATLHRQDKAATGMQKQVWSVTTYTTVMFRWPHKNCCAIQLQTSDSQIFWQGVLMSHNI